VWTLASFLSALWQLRTEKKNLELIKIRSEIEARCRLLRESRVIMTNKVYERKKSNSSIEIASDNGPSEASIQSEYLQEEERKVEPKKRDRRYRSEVLISTQTRFVAVFNCLIYAWWRNLIIFC
jgi:hypothetical protein